MADTTAFDFSGDDVSRAYDTELVPAVFEPWAQRLVREFGPWKGQTVLDLATGTGVVAAVLADAVGPTGRVVATDLNAGMLAVARERCAGRAADIAFVECPAAPLDLGNDAVDTAVCQQGFQFFGHRPAAARELRRVVRPGGSVIVTTWLPLDRCELFGAIAGALLDIDEPDTAAMMALPFDHMPADELAAAFVDADFDAVTVVEQDDRVHLPGGSDQALRFAHATPIGPRLRAFDDDQRTAFQQAFATRLETIGDDPTDLGVMTTNLMTARVP